MYTQQQNYTSIILCNSKRQVDLVAAVDVVLRDFKDTENQLQFSMFVLTNSEAIVPVKVVLKATEVQIVHNYSILSKH